jgi:hypothetical protein
VLAWLQSVGIDGLTVPWPSVGLGGLVTLCVLLILTGRLVPKSSLTAAERRAERWEAVAVEALRQNGKLVDGAEVTSDVLRAIPQARPDPDRSR